MPGDLTAAMKGLTEVSWKVAIDESTATALAAGETVTVCARLKLPEEASGKMKGALDAGEPVLWSLAIDLVLVTSGGDQVLDFTQVSGSVQPAS